MSDGTTMIPIPCPQGCGKPRFGIGTSPKTLRFRYVPANQGEMVNVEGLPEPTFTNKRREPPFVLVDYAGSGTELEVWPYRPVGEPPCSTPTQTEPELTNEPEGPQGGEA